MIQDSISNSPYGIFLDIDKVLFDQLFYTPEVMKKRDELFPDANDHTISSRDQTYIAASHFFESQAVENLDYLIAEKLKTRPVWVIIISGWRQGRSADDLKNKFLKVHNFSKFIVDKTPDRVPEEQLPLLCRGDSITDHSPKHGKCINWCRASEIRYWLQRNPLEDYCILDDSDSHLSEEFGDRFYKIDPEIYLTRKTVDQILKRSESPLLSIQKIAKSIKKDLEIEPLPTKRIQSKTRQLEFLPRDPLEKNLISAAQRDDFQAVKSWIEQGANVNYWVGKNTLSCLHFAAANQNFAMIKLLLENGAEKNCYNFEGKLPEVCLFEKKGKTVQAIVECFRLIRPDERYFYWNSTISNCYEVAKQKDNEIGLQALSIICEQRLPDVLDFATFAILSVRAHIGPNKNEFNISSSSFRRLRTSGLRYEEKMSST